MIKINIPDFNVDEIPDINKLSRFIEQFEFNLQMLNYRVNRVLEIDTTIKENQNEYLMTFDSAMALFRAMFLESKNLNGNYTFQNFCRLIGKPNIAQQIDVYLETKLVDWREKSIREVLKFLADKFVCHVDDITLEDLGMANFYMSFLKNPYEKNNLATIYSNLASIINKS